MGIYFNQSYTLADRHFQTLVQAKELLFEHLPLQHTGTTELHIGITVLGSPEADNVLIHSSGLHGVEGYVGSAIQLSLLDDTEHIPENTCLIICHVMNPYGMKHNRRFNENNVDLNRNFIDLIDDFPNNIDYARLNSLLNPKTPTELPGFKRKAIYKILRHGFTRLQQAVGQGQYQFPNGLFFGGNQLEQSAQLILSFLKERIRNPKKLFVLDVHAGLGKYGKEGLFLEGFQSQEDHRYLESCFKSSIIHVSPNHKNAYKIEGGYIQRIRQLFPNTQFYGLTQEFGIASPLNVLAALRKENFYHNYHRNTPSDLKAKEDLKALFCPEDTKWRKHALQKGRLRVKQVLELVSQ